MSKDAVRVSILLILRKNCLARCPAHGWRRLSGPGWSGGLAEVRTLLRGNLDRAIVEGERVSRSIATPAKRA